MKSAYTIALIGNPNSGKTTLFNAITGARQHVGNYPGVTVEYKEGKSKFNNLDLTIIDLPGTYSLTAFSPEEVVSRNYILEQKPDLIIDVIDSTNLERSLYLTVQLKEMNVPILLAFNMTDEAKKQGLIFDLALLSHYFDSPIIQTIGSREIGINDLMTQALKTIQSSKETSSFSINYGREVENEIEKLLPLIQETLPNQDHRWLIVKLLEEDTEILKHCPEAIKSPLNDSIKRIKGLTGDSAEMVISCARYGFISGACQEAVTSNLEQRHSISDKIDLVLANRFLGLPIFLFLMYLVFSLTFTIGQPFMDLIEGGFELLSQWISTFWPEGSESLLKSLLIDGIIGGVGSVVVFLPNIILLFLGIALLEDTGYMSRVAFIMDRLMHKIGLHGKSVIPMLIGFGCTVPAIMATRTLENRRDRIVTMLVAPLMSCGARLPIYTLIIPAFFPNQWQGTTILFSIYLIGILLAIILAKTLCSTVMKGESAPFVMELPPYRLPTLRGITIHMWERAWLYLKKAGTVILAIAIVLWCLGTFPKLSADQEAKYENLIAEVQANTTLDEVTQEKQITTINQLLAEEELLHSYIGRFGKALEPIIKPLGFDRRIGTALVPAFAAKEVFVSQMGITFSLDDEFEDEASQTTLREKLVQNYSPLVAFCIMLFCLISAPCMATFAVTKRESNSWGWAMAQLVGLTILAYIVTFIVYQVGTLLSLGV